MYRMLGVISALFLIVVTGTFAAPEGEGAAGGERTHLNLALPGDPGTFDPATNWLHILAAQQFLTLVDWDYSSSQPVANAAESWSVSEDGRTYTFTLRPEGLTWSDGQSGHRRRLRVFVPDHRRSGECGADLAYRAFVIENAGAVNAGEQPPWRRSACMRSTISP